MSAIVTFKVGKWLESGDTYLVTMIKLIIEMEKKYGMKVDLCIFLSRNMEMNHENLNGKETVAKLRESTTKWKTMNICDGEKKFIIDEYHAVMI